MNGERDCMDPRPCPSFRHLPPPSPGCCVSYEGGGGGDADAGRRRWLRDRREPGTLGITAAAQRAVRRTAGKEGGAGQGVAVQCTARQPDLVSFTLSCSSTYRILEPTLTHI